MYSFLKNYSKHISVCYRIIKLLSVLTYTLTHFYANKMLTLYLFKQQPQSRLSLIKALCLKLEKLNSVYIKIFQSLALNEDLLYDDEKDYLINYCDNVPYSSDCIDYKLLSDLHETYNISVLSAIPINSGIVGLVFDGYDSSNTKVVVKMLKRNIINDLRDLFDDLLYISYVCKLIPYINSFNITKLVLDNKELMLQQIDFLKEAYALERFAEKYKNNKEYRFPKVYKNITQRYNQLLVMENIKGLTLKTLETMDDAVKEEFAYIYLKFGILGILNYSAIHCDLHCGNVFFYINECTNDNTPKYQMGVIDFGLTCFPNKLNQNAYYIFLTQVLINKDYSQLFTVLHNVIEEKERFNAMPQLTKEALKKEICDSIELCVHNEINPKLIADFCKIFKNYNLNFTEEFHKLVLCLLNVNSFGNKLSKDVYACQMKLFSNLTSIHRLLDIP
jgi:predicted unusual protein kinase regulating ubiquinone biosynthesis (AarF/ABC1/UbiB family)